MILAILAVYSNKPASLNQSLNQSRDYDSQTALGSSTNDIGSESDHPIKS